MNASREAERATFAAMSAVSVAVPGNLRSRRVMERLGMTRDAADDYDHPNLPEGPPRRHVLYRLCRSAPRP
jgi:RimJ/RimL family protein N-acetyltransferase